MSVIINEEEFTTFADYMADENKVSSAEREQIDFEMALVTKMIEARKERGLSQRELAQISGIKQPAISRLESLKATPQIDTVFKLLNSLGYTLSIIPLKEK